VGATLSWQIQTPQPHKVRVQHAYHSARVLLYVDDRRILNRRNGEVLWDAGFEYEFHVDEARCRLRIGGAGCQLLVNGQVQSPSG
jgi:hypothetical protein